MNSLKHYIENAPEAGNYKNYGKLTVTPLVVSWETVNGERRPIKVPYEGQEIKPNETLELKFNVDVQEFNPSLAFTYDRSVTVVKSSKTIKTDWSETVLPSLIEVFGENWWDEIQKQPYVAVEDVPQIRSKNGKQYSTIKFVKRFASREECYQAAGLASDDGSVPENVINQVKALMASLGKDGTLKLLASKPFGDYDPEILVELAQF